MPEGAAVPAERALTAPLLPPAAWPAGLAMPQPPPAAPRCRRLRDAQQRARTAAALTAAPDADRSRPLLEPSRVRAEPRTQVAADERRAPPRPARLAHRWRAGALSLTAHAHLLPSASRAPPRRHGGRCASTPWAPPRGCQVTVCAEPCAVPFALPRRDCGFAQAGLP